MRTTIGIVIAAGVWCLLGATSSEATELWEPDRITTAGVADLQAAMASGELSSVAITRACLERIRDLDGGLNAVIVTNPEAESQARALDAERDNGTVRGRLHGIPVLLKDNIESKDPMATTAGSLALADNITGRDAFVVARLREAGAVILGKTNLSEWANFRSERSSSGWSGVGGQTNNPYDPSRNPCGSSSGSPAWKTDLVNGDHFLGASSSFPARAGYPDITVPMGAVHGLPVGISFFGPAFSEPTLIEAAHAFERATGFRTSPGL